MNALLAIILTCFMIALTCFIGALVVSCIALSAGATTFPAATLVGSGILTALFMIAAPID